MACHVMSSCHASHFGKLTEDPVSLNSTMVNQKVHYICCLWLLSFILGLWISGLHDSLLLIHTQKFKAWIIDFKVPIIPKSFLAGLNINIMLSKMLQTFFDLIKTGIFYKFLNLGFFITRPSEAETGTSDDIRGNWRRFWSGIRDRNTSGQDRLEFLLIINLIASFAN